MPMLSMAYCPGVYPNARPRRYELNCRRRNPDTDDATGQKRTGAYRAKLHGIVGQGVSATSSSGEGPEDRVRGSLRTQKRLQTRARQILERNGSLAMQDAHLFDII